MTSRLTSGAKLVKRAKHEVEQEKHELIPGSHGHVDSAQSSSVTKVFFPVEFM